MKIKEKELKELENLILKLLDNSSDIQDKIRSVCGTAHETALTYTKNNTPTSDSADKRKIAQLEAEINDLNEQLDQIRGDHKRSSEDMKKYHSLNLQLKSECERLKSESERIREQKTRLESEINKASEEIDRYKEYLKEIKNETEQLQKQNKILTSELAEANNNIQKLKEVFSAPVILLEKFKTLSPSARRGLSDVICDKNEILFITSCSSPEHLKAIWMYTKKLAGSSGDENDIEILKELFDYFFDAFNNSLSEPMYVRDNVDIGYSFDDDKYDRCTGSSTSGKIKEIILRGYKSINTGIMICRSVVRV